LKPPTIDDWEIISSLKKNGSEAIRQLGALGAEPVIAGKTWLPQCRGRFSFVWFSREHIHKMLGCSGAAVRVSQEVTPFLNMFISNKFLRKQDKSS